MSNPFKHILNKVFENKLPGLQSQLKMAPVGRLHTLDDNMISDARKSAVLILLYHQNKNLYVPFIKRISDGSKHSGQIAFPGGKHEPSDSNLIQTALREAEEEVGVNSNHLNVLKKLTPLYIPVSNFLVQPVVAFSEKKPQFIIAEDEVDKLYNIDLNELLYAKIINKTFVAGKYEITAPFFVLEEIEIWGATAMILSEFIDILKRSNKLNNLI
jgi:8-oxo-dGTP pyrophosphatase MutT (NUDIX family)